MQKTGNKNPATGQDEYVGADGSLTYMTDDQYIQTFGGPSEPIDYTPTELYIPESAVAPVSPTAPVTPIVEQPLPVPEPLPIPERIPAPDALARPQPPPPTPLPTSIPVTESTLTSKVISPEVDKAQKLAAVKASQALSSLSDAEIAKNNASVLEATAVAARESKFLKQEQAKQIAEQNIIAEKQAKLDAISNEYSGMQLDSNRFWKNRSTGDRIMAAIAIGLGALSQAQGGGENLALSIIQGAIDKDIEEQKFNISQAGKNIETQRGLFSDILKRTGDERIARLKTHELGLKAVLSEYQVLALQSNNPIIKANAQLKQASIEDALAKNLVDQSAVLVTQTKEVPLAEPKMTIGEETYEKEIAKVLTEWSSGGESTVAGNLALMEDALAQMKADPDWVSGRFIGRVPELLRSKKSLDVMQQVRKAAQANLRTTLGSQFTEKEGERIMAFAFDPKLTPEQNIKMLEMDILNLKARKANLDEQNQHFMNNRRSMRGWTGPQLNTYNPFVNLKEDAKK